jgi:hypothetical protein
MAIDTAERRRAVAALSGAHWFGPGVTPDTAKDGEWRQQVAFGYPGISAGEAVEPATTAGWIPPIRRRYILPNGMNVMASPHEVAAMLARMNLEINEVQAPPADMADLRDALVSALKAKPRRGGQRRSQIEHDMRQADDDMIILMMMS